MKFLTGRQMNTRSVKVETFIVCLDRRSTQNGFGFTAGLKSTRQLPRFAALNQYKSFFNYTF